MPRANLSAICKYCGDGIVWLEDGNNYFPAEAATVEPGDESRQAHHVRHTCPKNIEAFQRNRNGARNGAIEDFQ